MKKITIELTDTEYKKLKEEAEGWKQTIEDFLVIAGQLYNEIVRKKTDLQTENYHLEKEIEARNNVIDKYEKRLQAYYEKVGDLDKI